MLIECEECRGREHGCGECVVSALLESALRDETADQGPEQVVAYVSDGIVEERVPLDARERRALALLADLGLVAPLRRGRIPRAS
ncbi:hypothetical protein [Actinomadura gamaensis]|uniref:Uncharacterized protein n=1 Tax=Actinomadura gamaensis TaxID=1763541 RepID=A0ABV9TTQ5_9ACTN